MESYGKRGSKERVSRLVRTSSFDAVLRSKGGVRETGKVPSCPLDEWDAIEEMGKKSTHL